MSSECIEGRAFGNIGDKRGDACADWCPSERQGHSLAHVFLRHIADRHMATLDGELLREFPPDARTAAGDDRNQACKVGDRLR